MRRRYIRTIALTAALVWPSQALAGPIFAFIGSIIGAVGAVVTAVASTAIGAALLQAAVGIGISYLAQRLTARDTSSLTPLQNSPTALTSNPSDRMTNLRQDISDMEVVYGAVRKGGPVGLWRAADGSRYILVIFACHPINAFTTFYADDRALTLSGPTVTSEPFGSRSCLFVEGQTGAANARPALFASLSGITTDYNWKGFAIAAIRAINVDPEDFLEVYTSGDDPVITALVQGKKVYDPRTETTVYSNNAALVLADWVVSTDGLGREVDWADVEVEADICDQDVTNLAGGTQKRWTLNGTYPLPSPREDVRAAMGVACDAYFFERADGKVGFYVGRYITPTITITDIPGDGKPSHILSAQYTEGFDGTDQINAQSIQYVEPTNGYRQQQSAPVTVDVDEPYSEDTKALYFIDSHNQAARVAKRLLLTARSQWKARLVLNLQGIRLMEHRFFRLNHVEAGLDVTMEIDRLQINDDFMSVTVECHAVTSADFDFDASTEEGQAPIKEPDIGASAAPDPENVTADGIAGGITVSWDAPGRSGLLTQVRVRTSSGPGEWLQYGVSAGQLTLIITGLDEVSYDVQARHITSGGNASDWAPADGSGDPTLTATPGVSVPLAAAPAAFTATGGTGEADLEWTTPNDANCAGTIIKRNTVDDEDTATEVDTFYSGPNVTLTYTDTGLSADDYYYYARTINSAGDESATGLASGATTVS